MNYTVTQLFLNNGFERKEARYLEIVYWEYWSKVVNGTEIKIGVNSACMFNSISLTKHIEDITKI